VSGELSLMHNFFFDRLASDTSPGGFVELFGASNLASRIGVPIADQAAASPLVNIRNLGQVGGGALRIKNQGAIVWIQQRFLVVAINQKRRYPSAIAARMETLFELTTALAVSGGVIHHCYLEAPYSTMYESSGKVYAEQGGYWIIAAKAA